MKAVLSFGMVLAALSASVAVAVEPFPVQPVANPGAIVVASDKKARFTVLTDCLVRAEFAGVSAGSFEDRATLAVINRKLPVPTFTQKESEGKLTISTSCVTVSYTLGSGSFASGALSVASAAGRSPAFSWSLDSGLVSKDNLLGTIRSLDMIDTISLNCTKVANVKVHDESLHCVWSPFSREGWHVISDINSTILGDDDWVTNSTPAVTEDLYFFGHGLDFAAAVKDYTAISGRPALLPRYSLGVMWSRWYDLSFADVRYLVEDGYEAHGLPLDVMILDMDWHAPYGVVPPKQTWTGWTFDRDLFPSPDDFFAYLRHKGLGTSLNIHDASGVDSNNLRYAEFAKAVGADPSTNATIPAWIDDKTYIQAVEDVLLKPFVEGSGYAFAPWRDWQQGGETCISTRGLNPTIWLNHVSCTDAQRRGENWRSYTLARYGGMGSQRYPTGFSGDVVHRWDSLAYQVFFSSTAASVAYQWSNDIVGRNADGYDLDSQNLHTRWVQWGAFSALFRTHDAGGAVGGCASTGGCALVELWNTDKEHLDAHRAALAERARLLPYWYTLNRQAYDTGLMPVRPMYFAFAEDETSYAEIVRNQQYMIGDALLVSPVTAPPDNVTTTTNWTVWLPSGSDWYDDITGRLWDPSSFKSSPANLSSAYDISEVPRAFRGGSIVPRAPYHSTDVIAVARRNFTVLEFSVYPGGDGSPASADVYEDDGFTLDFQTAPEGTASCVTTATSTVKAAPSSSPASAATSTTTVSISTKGTFPGLPASRTYGVSLVMAFPPTSVTAGGAAVPYARWGCDSGATASCYTYDGNTLTTKIFLVGVTTSSGASVTVEAPSYTPASSSPLSGVKGAIQRARLVKRVVADPYVRPGTMKDDFYSLQRLSTLGDLLTSLAQAGDAAGFLQAASSAPALLASAVAQVEASFGHALNPPRAFRASALLRTASSGWM